MTFVALQLAYFMDFSDVVLVRVDHRFRRSGPANRLVTMTGADPDHFDPKFFGAGVEWQLPDLMASERSYRIAKQAFEADGRRIIDATVDGSLRGFPKVDFDELLRR